MTGPLLILGVASIYFGYIFKDMFIGLGSSFFASSITVLPQHITLIHAELLSPLTKFIPVIFSLTGAFIALIGYSFFPSLLLNLKLNLRQVYIFLNNK